MARAHEVRGGREGRTYTWVCTSTRRGRGVDIVDEVLVVRRGGGRRSSSLSESGGVSIELRVEGRAGQPLLLFSDRESSLLRRTTDQEQSRRYKQELSRLCNESEIMQHKPTFATVAIANENDSSNRYPSHITHHTAHYQTTTNQQTHFPTPHLRRILVSFLHHLTSPS